MTENSEQRFDLFGVPVVETDHGRGRPAHEPDARSRNKVRLLVAFGKTDAKIAKAIGVSVPTLTKYYFAELGDRSGAREQLRAEHLMMIFEAAVDGNVGAMKELGRLINEDDLRRAGLQYEKRPQRGKAPAAPKPGKKEQRRQAAQQVPADWETLVH